MTEEMTEESAFHTIGAWQDWAPYQGALLIPSDTAGRALLQLRDRQAAAAHPGKWGLFGGGVDPGEALLDAAQRELAEETGLTPPADAFRPLARIISPHSRKRLYIYALTLNISPNDIRLGEGAGFGFIEPQDFARLELVPAARVVLSYWSQNHQA